jgi:hypothetical protein
MTTDLERTSSNGSAFALSATLVARNLAASSVRLPLLSATGITTTTNAALSSLDVSALMRSTSAS